MVFEKLLQTILILKPKPSHINREEISSVINAEITIVIESRESSTGNKVFSTNIIRIKNKGMLRTIKEMFLISVETLET